MSRGATIAVSAAVAFVVAFLLAYAQQAEDRRQDRIAAAEDKYDLTYLRVIKDGEGGGTWRMADGRVITCRISGDTDDPTLACGKNGTEPRLQPTKP